MRSHLPGVVAAAIPLLRQETRASTRSRPGATQSGTRMVMKLLRNTAALVFLALFFAVSYWTHCDEYYPGAWPHSPAEEKRPPLGRE